MSLDQNPADGAESSPQAVPQSMPEALPQTITQSMPQTLSVPPSQAAAGTVPPPLRRPLKSFIEEARDAALQGLKSSVVFTAVGLTLTFEKQDAGTGAGTGAGSGAGAGDADNFATSPHGATHKGQARTTGQPAPKPWR